MSDRDFHQQQEGYGLGHVGNINNNTQYSNHQQQQLQQQQHHHQQHQHQYHHHQQQQSHQQQSHQQQYHPQSSINQQTYKEYPGATFIQHEGGYPEEYYPDQQQYYDPNYYLYYQQQYIDHQYPQYEGQYQEYHNNYDEADISNLDEIDRALASLETDGLEDDYEEEPTPSGALPTVNGVLTSHAAQFWFPDSRDCSCCQGFKHGCKCCSGRVQVCAVCSQKSSSESLPPPAETNESDLPPTAPSTVRIPSNSNKSPNAEIPVKETSKNVTKSLVVQAPSKTLVVQAPSKTLVVEAPSPNSRGAQSWFPECRDCSCCQGFKHGCSCCQGSSRVCSCVATKPSADTKTAGECSYFKSGNCKYGDSCKFRHT